MMNDTTNLIGAIKRKGVATVAAKLRISKNAVYKWIDQGSVPIERASRIETELGISRRDLRPSDWGDIWPELIDAEHPWPPVAADTQENAHAAT